MPLQHLPPDPNGVVAGRARRIRAVLVTGAIVAALVVAAIVVALAGGGQSASRPGCVEVTAASSTGGATFTACGHDARHFCSGEARRSDLFARKAQVSCREAGYR